MTVVTMLVVLIINPKNGELQKNVNLIIYALVPH